MADNTQLNTGTGGDVIASDDIGSVKFQRVKLIHGPDGVNNGDVASTNPLPVRGTALIDDATGATDSGFIALATRDDTLGALTPADGDNVQLRTNSSGALWVVAIAGAAQKVDDASFTPGTDSVIVVGYEADEGSTDSVDEGDAGAARMTLDRKQIVTPYPHTAGGLSTFMASGSDGATALTSNAQVISAGAGQIYGYYIHNPNGVTEYVHFYSTAAASTTVGSTNPLFTLPIPASTAANLMATHGITFTGAFSIAATSTAGSSGAPPIALDAVVWYK